MTPPTICDVNAHLDALMKLPELAPQVSALRELVGQGRSVREITALTRGMFPSPLVAMLVADHAGAQQTSAPAIPEPVIEA